MRVWVLVLFTALPLTAARRHRRQHRRDQYRAQYSDYSGQAEYQDYAVQLDNQYRYLGCALLFCNVVFGAGSRSRTPSCCLPSTSC